MTKQEILNLISKITVAKVVSIEKHPNADRLLVIKLYLGEETLHGHKQPLYKTVCTAANNFKEGDLVPYLGVGEVVPGFLMTKGEEFRLEVRNMRGIDSEGMILAEDEIGTGEDHTGILILETGEENIGKSLTDIIPEKIQNALDKTFEKYE